MALTSALLEQFPLPQRPARKLRVGLIGLGGIFEHSHLPALLHLLNTGWIEVGAIADISERRAETMGKFFPHAGKFSDAMLLMSEARCDAILAFTPPVASEQIVIEAIRRRTPLFVEKPVCHVANRLDQLADQAEAAHIPVQVAYNRRSQPLAANFQKLVSEFTTAGGVHHVIARFWRANRNEPIFYPDTLGHPLDFLASCFGPLEVTRIQRWDPIAGSGLLAGIQIGLKSGDLTLELDSRPAVGRACETYEAIGNAVSVALSYSPVDKGGDAASLTRFQNREETILASFASQDVSDESRSYLRGFAHQLAAFCRLATGADLAPTCTLRDAAAAMRLMNHIIAP